MTGPYSSSVSVPADRSEQHDRDDVLLRCAICVVCFGVAAVCVAAYGCTDPVLRVFAPELSWLLLAPAFLVVLVGGVGIYSSCREASKLFRSQFAVFLLVLTTLLVGAGVYSYFSSGATAGWMDRGCTGYVASGLWRDSGYVEANMKGVHKQYEQLHTGWIACRSLNPLVYDLAKCGLRAVCDDGNEAREQPMFDFFHITQVKFDCGGFCSAEVPLFGLATMADTLEEKDPCAPKMAAYVESFGYLFCATAVVLAVPVGVVALILFCASERADDDFEEVENSDLDEEDVGHYYGHHGHEGAGDAPGYRHVRFS